MQPPPNHVAMMQIECEVTNTKLLHVKEDAIPLHMMAAHHMMNNNSDGSNEGGEKNGSRNNGENHEEYGRSGRGANGSIDQINHRDHFAKMNINNNHKASAEHDDIHSYYRGGYNLSFHASPGLTNISGEPSLDMADDITNITDFELNARDQDELTDDFFTNNSISAGIAAGLDKKELQDEGEDVILQRSPGIVPRRFNRNGKVRDSTASIDINASGNYSNGNGKEQQRVG